LCELHLFDAGPRHI